MTFTSPYKQLILPSAFCCVCPEYSKTAIFGQQLFCRKKTTVQLSTSYPQVILEYYSKTRQKKVILWCDLTNNHVDAILMTYQQRFKEQQMSDLQKQLYRIYLELVENGGWESLGAESQAFFKQQLDVA